MRRVCLQLVFLAVLIIPAIAHASPDDARARARLSGIGVPFIANDGQVDERVAYYAPTFAGTVFVTRRGEVVYGLSGRPDEAKGGRPVTHGPGWSLTETFRGGKVTPAGQVPAPTAVSSLRGNDPARWRSDLPTFGEVGLGEVWPGVSVALKTRGRSVEKIFTVAPGASVDRIRMRVAGAQALRLGPDGALVAKTGLGDVTFTPPVAFQEHDGGRTMIPVAYRLRRGEYRFKIGAYDRTRPLVIDPILQSTYLGGGGLEGGSPVSLAIHQKSGDVYVAGTTQSSTFPGTSGGFQLLSGGTEDVFVARLDPGLTTLKQATFLGGSGSDLGSALAIDDSTFGSGKIFVAGSTDSADFPGGTPDGRDAFVVRLSEDLRTREKTFLLGRPGDDFASAVAIRPPPGTGTGPDFARIWVAGGAVPAASLALDAFLVWLNEDMDFNKASLFGGSGLDIATALVVNPDTGDVYVAGFTTSSDFSFPFGTAVPGFQSVFGGIEDGFVAAVYADSSSFTYVGGSGSDGVGALQFDRTDQRVYIAGTTSSAVLPGTASGLQNLPAGGSDAFVAYLNAALTQLTYTFLGGSGNDEGLALSVRPSGTVHVVGATSSPDFPASPFAFQPQLAVGDLPAPDAFQVDLDHNLTQIQQATYLGGKGTDRATAVVVHPGCCVYVAGLTSADTAPSDFPGVAGGAQPTRSADGADAFVLRHDGDLRPPPADLVIVKTHSGNFGRGQKGATYLITVTNIGGTVASVVQVTDTLPAGLTLVGMSGGAGWTCLANGCTYTVPLLPGATTPAITVTVDVAAGATSPQVNVADVTVPPGDPTPFNNTVADSTVIVNAPDLAIQKATASGFSPGQVGSTYTITVSNVGTAATQGFVTVVDILPTGLAATDISGAGWSCAPAEMSCSRTEALNPGESYPVITVTVDVSPGATGAVFNTATVSGGGDVNPTNNTASALTLVIPAPDLTLAKSHTGTFVQGHLGGTYFLTVRNVGTAPSTGVVTVTDTLPAGLDATSLAGPGWTCTLATLTCIRADALAPGPAIPPSCSA